MITNIKNKKSKEKFSEKILIIMDEKYKHDESFIKLGPIKNIKKFGGKTLNVNFSNSKFDLIENQIKFFRKKYTKGKKTSLKEKDDIFFINCLKLLITIYYNKTIKVSEKNYKNEFLENIKKIHLGLTEDNVEYLESTELIIKENNNATIIIRINYLHDFIKELISLNFNLFLEHKILFNFLKESGY